MATRTADLTDLLLDVRAGDENGVDVEAPLRYPVAGGHRRRRAAVRPLGSDFLPRAPEVGNLRQRVRELSEAARRQDLGAVPGLGREDAGPLRWGVTGRPLRAGRPRPTTRTA